MCIRDRSIVISALIGAFTSYYTHYHYTVPTSEEPNSTLLGTKRPDFSLFDYKDKQVSISEFDGKVVMINFWASWCPPCRREIPVFSEVREFYKENGFEVIGVAIDEKKEAEEFLNSMPHVQYPQLIGYNDATVVAKSLGNTRGGLPYSVILDRNGIIQFTKAGEIKKEELIDLIEPLF